VNSPIEIRKSLALARRDIYNWSSYKSAAITSLLTGVIGVATWGFTSTFVSGPVPQYDANYVSFLMSGILVANLILPLGQGIQNRLNPWTLENILMTGIRSPSLVLGTVLWPYTLSVILFIPQIFVGVYIFGAQFNINFISLVVAILVSSIIVFSLAMISTGFKIVTKVNDPATWAINMAATLFAGMTYPVSHLNEFIPGLSTVSWFIPQTWIFHIVRLASLTNGSLVDPAVAEAFMITFLIGVFLLFLSVRVFRWGLNRAKKEGTIGWY
jgi:ABC-type multidrug transport system permease subunit